MKKCCWTEEEKDYFSAECDEEKAFWLDWNYLRNFDFCPYCGKKIKIKKLLDS